MGLRLPDLITIVECYALFVLITMLWIHKTQPENVALTTLNSLLIPLRLFVVHAIIFAIYLPFPGMLSATVPFVAVAAMCVLPFATIDFIPGGGNSAFSVGKMLMIPAYGLRQFVIGFPDKQILMDRSPESVTPLFDPRAALWVEDD